MKPAFALLAALCSCALAILAYLEFAGYSVENFGSLFGLQNKYEEFAFDRANFLFTSGLTGFECSYEEPAVSETRILAKEDRQKHAIECMNGRGKQVLTLERDGDDFVVSRTCENENVRLSLRMFVAVNDPTGKDRWDTTGCLSAYMLKD